MTSRTKVKTNFEDGKPKEWRCRGNEKGILSDLGGTCHNDKSGLFDGDDGGIGMRMR